MLESEANRKKKKVALVFMCMNACVPVMTNL